MGEALYKLKYQADWSQVAPLAAQVAESIVPLFDRVGLIIPMPASIVRRRQPVNEIAEELGRAINVPVFADLIVKATADTGGKQLKDMTTKAEKKAALMGRFTINDSIIDTACWNALLLDDLYDTGATMEVACAALRTYPKIEKVYVAALTW